MAERRTLICLVSVGTSSDYSGDLNLRARESDKRLSVSSLGKLTQKVLSSAVDERTFARLTAAEVTSLARRAHLKLVSASGAGHWLHAVPGRSTKLDNPPALYKVMLQRWLRIPFSDQDLECPCCDGVLEARSSFVVLQLCKFRRSSVGSAV